ncbi:MAG TPA: hypothetical protein VFX60_08075 [Micromonospora sp.]|nr:hypothetical protein [Micromonospora sp.]
MLVPWRSRAETYLIAPLVILTVAYGGSAASRHVTEGYWTAVIAKAGLLLFIIAPICALAAAWEGARYRRGELHDYPALRPQWQIVAVAVAPSMLLGVLGVSLASVMLAPRAVGAPGIPNPWLLLVYLLVVAAHVMVGYTIGRWFLPAIALPAALLGSYVWLAYPAGITPAWLRHLNGLSFEACCAIDQMPATRAMIGTGVLASGVIITVVVALRSGRVSRLIGAGCLVLSGAVAVGAVWPLGPSAAEPRTGQQSCAGESPTICLWPEQEGARQTIDQTLRPAYANLAAAGIALPPTVATQDTPATDQLFVPMEAVPRSTDLLWSLIVSIVPNTTPECAVTGPHLGAEALGPISAWLALTAGMPAAELESAVPPEDIALANRVRSLPGQQQLAWYEANRAAANDCTARPPLDPATFAGTLG